MKKLRDAGRMKIRKSVKDRLTWVGPRDTYVSKKLTGVRINFELDNCHKVYCALIRFLGLYIYWRGVGGKECKLLSRLFKM